MKKLQFLTRNIGDMATKRRITWIINSMSLNDNDNVLDCGCGDGLFLSIISRVSKCNLYGVDMNEKSLNLAKNHLFPSANVFLVKSNIISLPYPDNFFDKIIFSEVLEHIDNDRFALAEVARVLKEDGELFMTVPNKNYPFLWDPINKIMEIISGKHIKHGFWAGIWNMHLRLYSFKELEKLIENSTLKVMSKTGITYYCLPFNHILLHFLKKILDKQILPERMQNSANKFAWDQEKQSLLIRLCYYLWNSFDRLNDGLSLGKPSVCLGLIAKKTLNKS